MLFPFQWFPTHGPAPALRGGTKRFKPIVPCIVTGPAGNVLQYVLVDSGADEVVLPITLAPVLGIDLTAAPTAYTQPAGNAPPIPLHFAEVILRLSDGNEVCRWRAVVGFTPTKLRFAVFGIAGGIEYFRTTFDLFNQTVEMIPLPSLPATQDPAP